MTLFLRSLGPGSAPAYESSRVDVAAWLSCLPALKSGGGPRQGSTRIPLGQTLVVGQIAASLVLLVVAGPFVRSLLKLKEIDTGFDPELVLPFELSPPAGEWILTVEELRNLHLRLVARAECVPGVLAASALFSGVFSRGTWGNASTIEGLVPPQDMTPRLPSERLRVLGSEAKAAIVDGHLRLSSRNGRATFSSTHPSSSMRD